MPHNRLIAKLVNEFRQYMMHQGSKHKQTESLAEDYGNLKRKVIQKLDDVNEHIKQIDVVESHLHRLKADLHFISGQVHRSYVASTKAVGFYTMLIIIVFQTIFIVLFLSNNRQRRHRYD
ncbi:hypothetical protein RF11_10202 [Thelohanellus kitauei]|uniref:Uncharacterized protein n=1 Tax=Thelohanellus kitauei TaxID=669202 RepID=A0A0C2MZU7_THEKT|nr:hypothetical protein RF11_10202 [Thelohanellus kitauei]